MSDASNAPAFLDVVRRSVCGAIAYDVLTTTRVACYTPFSFPDGDGFVIVLKKPYTSGWRFTDEGHTLAHLSRFGIDVGKGTRAALIDSALKRFGVTNDDGELYIEASEADPGAAFWAFAQALTQVVDVAAWTKERVESAFLDDLGAALRARVPPDRVFERYVLPRDTSKDYPIDFKLNGGPGSPIFVFGVHSNDKCLRVACALHQYLEWHEQFWPLIVFEKESRIVKSDRRRLADAISASTDGKVFPRLEGASVGDYVARKLGLVTS